MSSNSLETTAVGQPQVTCGCQGACRANHGRRIEGCMAESVEVPIHTHPEDDGPVVQCIVFQEQQK